jgi:hypothetical protein
MGYVTGGLKQKQGRVTERSPTERKEKLGKEEASFQGMSVPI